jgi:long-subunit acyl-CoA synthetase (AMP-forming)
MLVDTRIAGPDGTDRAAGQIGELLVRGPNVMAGYWNRPDATRRVFDEHGWLRTGDAAFADTDGCLFIVGRMEDAFGAAGDIVHPGIVERLLLQHSSVAEACVLGGRQGSSRICWRCAAIVLGDRQPVPPQSGSSAPSPGMPAARSCDASCNGGKRPHSEAMSASSADR